MHQHFAWSLHFATPFVCVTSSAKCVSPSIPSPLCFSITRPFLVCACVALSVAFTLSLWLLMHWCWHQCPSYGAHHASHPPLSVCVVMAFLHCPGPVNHFPPFLCVFWCVPQATASICTDRGGICFVVLSSTKVSHERHHEETHPHTLLSFVFSLHLFYGAFGGSESPSPPLSTLFTIAIHASVHGKE